MCEGQRDCKNSEDRQHTYSTGILLPVSLAHYSGGAPGKKRKNDALLPPQPAPSNSLSIPLANYWLLRFLWNETNKQTKRKKETLTCLSFLNQSELCQERRDPAMKCDLVLNCSFQNPSPWDSHIVRVVRT